MKKGKIIAILSAAVITAGSMGVVAFAENLDWEASKDPQTPPTQQISKDIIKNVSPSQDERQDMIDIMLENGFQDAAQYMLIGDYEKMNDFMNNLSEEDYQKMIDLMRDNGYDEMAQMMESVGREDMIEMHNSMDANFMHGAGMMGGFTSID